MFTSSIFQDKQYIHLTFSHLLPGYTKISYSDTIRRTPCISELFFYIFQPFLNNIFVEFFQKYFLQFFY